MWGGDLAEVVGKGKDRVRVIDGAEVVVERVVQVAVAQEDLADGFIGTLLVSELKGVVG